MNQIVISNRCPTCNHPSRIHVIDALGKPRCPECPQEICGEVSETPSMLDFGELTTMGLKHISEMTERELVEEIMHAQYVALTSARFPIEHKRHMVAQIRVSSAKARIYREAGVEPDHGLFGGIAGW